MRINRINRRENTSWHPYGRTGRAFTMVEVIVAMTLLGITILAVFGALRTCAGATHHARLLTGSVLLAERLLTETCLDRNRAFETREGTEGIYQWRIRVVPTPVESLGAVHVRVKWPEQQRQQQYDLYSLVHMQSFSEQR